MKDLCKNKLAFTYLIFVGCFIIFPVSHFFVVHASFLYEGQGIFDTENQKLASFRFRSFKKNWIARSLVKEDTLLIQEILSQQPPEKRIYLPEPETEQILEWQRNVKNEQPFYRPFLIENQEKGILALVEVHTMPRAVRFPKEQQKILNYYYEKGLMTYDPNNEEENYTGKYRPVNDGSSSMARLRILPVSTILHDIELISDIIKGTSALIRTFADLRYPMHPYSFDNNQGIPKLLMSYTALEEPIREAYQRADFILEENPCFKEFWPSIYRKKLPEKMVIASQFVSTVPSSLMNLSIAQSPSIISSHMANKKRSFPEGTLDIFLSEQEGINTALLHNIENIVKESIYKGKYPGAVVLFSHRGQPIYRGVFGNRRLIPDIAPMDFDTIFDVASLTKVVATTPAIMQLIEQGKLGLDDTVSQYWPSFAEDEEGKKDITIRHLLTHTSGLPADLPHFLVPTEHLTSYSWYSWRGTSTALKEIEKINLLHRPGEKFIYSDIGFIALGNLISIITGTPLDQYAKDNIFDPAGMKSSFFLPSPDLRDQIAPTQIVDGILRWGEVHDPTAYAMGGVAGSAGVFSTAGDLDIYAQVLLNQGLSKGGKYLLSPLTILKMITPQTPSNLLDIRGLGWDIDSYLSSARGVLFSTSAFGHTGWTGTSMWLDPITQSSLIILTSRTHPLPQEPTNPLIKDRHKIANIVAASICDIAIQGQSNTGKGEINRAFEKKGK